MNLILIGYRGTGKSTVGKLTAQKLKRKFIDVDDFIEKQEKKTIKEIFDLGGEELFRSTERNAIVKLSRLDNMVLAPGGGAVLNEENMANLKRNGFLILLEADADTINGRLNNDPDKSTQRPSLTEKSPLEEIKHVLAVRHDLYQKNANVVINSSSETIEQISEKVFTMFNNHQNTKSEQNRVNSILDDGY